VNAAARLWAKEVLKLRMNDRTPGPEESWNNEGLSSADCAMLEDNGHNTVIKVDKYALEQWPQSRFEAANQSNGEDDEEEDDNDDDDEEGDEDGGFEVHMTNESANAAARSAAISVGGKTGAEMDTELRECWDKEGLYSGHCSRDDYSEAEITVQKRVLEQ
jgi:hypothetical protein